MKSVDQLTDEDALKVLQMMYPDKEVNLKECRTVPTREISLSGANVGIIWNDFSEDNVNPLDSFMLGFDECESQLNKLGYTIEGYYDD